MALYVLADFGAFEARPRLLPMYARQEMPAADSWVARLEPDTWQSVQFSAIPNVDPPISAR